METGTLFVFLLKRWDFIATKNIIVNYQIRFCYYYAWNDPVY